MSGEDSKNYDTIKNGPTITPEMINLVHKTLETRGLLYYSEGGVYVPTEKGWRLLSEIKPVEEEMTARGSHDITASGDSCIVFTKHDRAVGLKEKDCIVGVKADKSCRELGDSLKDSIKGSSKLKVTIEADGVSDSFEAFGSPALTATSEDCIAIRKDDYIDDKTIAIMADKSASELKPELLEKLKKPETKITITLKITP